MPNATDKNNIVFFTDLDGTLIHSRRHGYDGGVKWVEYIGGKPRSFISEGAFETLKELNIEIIPVTSRSIEQFNRLKDFLKELKVRIALINNGSLLVNLSGVNDESEKRFNLDTMKVCMPYAEDMEKAFHSTSLISGVRSIRAALPCFISGAHDDPERAEDELRGAFAESRLRIYSDNHRVYISPEIITKGLQVKRFCEFFGIEKKIAAGDSENDVSMLEQADLCLCPKELSEHFSPRTKRLICSGFFTDDIADNLRRIFEDGGSGYV